MRSGDIPSTTVSIPCDSGTLSELPSTSHAAGRRSTFFNSGRPFVIFCYFLCEWETPCQLPSTFLATGTFSVNFRQLSVNFLQLYVRPGELPKMFYAAGKRSDNFRQFSVQSVNLSSTSVNFLCGRETFCQIPSILCATGVLPISVNFPYGLETFRQLPSTFHASGRSSDIFHQLSVQLGDFPLTSVSIP